MKIGNAVLKYYSNTNTVEVFLPYYGVHRPEAPPVRRGSVSSMDIKAENFSKSSKRAATQLKGLVIENNLNKMWTLTYRHDMENYDAVVSDFVRFARKLNRKLKKKFNYVRVIAIQEARAKKYKSEILHIHFATDEEISHSIVCDKWEHGSIFQSNRSLEKVAGYLVKNINKDLKQSKYMDRKRYSASQGLKKPYSQVLTLESDYKEMLITSPAVIYKNYNGDEWFQVKDPEHVKKLLGRTNFSSI